MHSTPKQEHSHSDGNEHRGKEHHDGEHHDTDRHIGRMTRFLQPRLLLLLAQKKQSYGYELIEDIGDSDFGGTTPDTGTIYRSLRDMEKEQLVTSEWDTKGTGPAKRIYCLTDEGKDVLHSWYVSIRKRKTALEKFLEAYEAYVKASET